MNPFLPKNEFTFELTLALDPALGFSSGELAELVLDGIMLLDAQGALFPGVTDPAHGDRVLEIGVMAAGNRQLGRPQRTDRCEQLMRRRGPTKLKAVAPQLQAALGQLGTAVVRLQMLRAKTAGTWAALNDGGTPSDLERGKAQIAAIERLCGVVEEVVRPLL